MVEFVFVNPEYLIFFLAVPVLILTHYLTLKYSQSRALKFANFEAIARVSKGEMLATPYASVLRNKSFWIILLRLLTLSLVILAISGLTIKYESLVSESDYVLALDVSSSMLADDFKPNRLIAARDSAQVFLEHMPKRVNVGLITFSGNVFVESELTDSIKEVNASLMRINLSDVGGTNIGDALITGANVLGSSEKEKTIVLLTDGQSNFGTPIEEAIDYVKKKVVVVETIGMATEEGGKLEGLNITSKLDEATLIKIANVTGGNYYHVSNEEQLKKAYENVARAKKRKVSFNATYWLLFGALMALFFEWGLVNVKYKAIT